MSCAVSRTALARWIGQGLCSLVWLGAPSAACAQAAVTTARAATPAAGPVAQPAAAQPPPDALRPIPAPAPPKAKERSGYRILKIAGGVVFGVTYGMSFLVSTLYHPESPSRSQERHMGYLAYPLAGPFLSMVALEDGGEVMIPLGVLQTLAAGTLLVGIIGPGKQDVSPAKRSVVQIRPLWGSQGTGLALGASF